MLSAENVTVRYGDYTVVDGVSFSLKEGQWLMLAGPNGAGKSTLIHAISQGAAYGGIIRLDGKNIRSVICYQYTTETEVHLSADIFVDATGHGTVGVLAGAKYRIGTESKYEFSEPSAPEVSNNHCMGDSLLFSARDRGEPVKFVAPEWAYHFSEEDLAIRPHTSRMVFNASDGSVYSEKKAGSRQLPDYYDSTSGYWWIEVTGHGDEMTRESEIIREKLIS